MLVRYNIGSSVQISVYDNYDTYIQYEKFSYNYITNYLAT